MSLYFQLTDDRGAFRDGRHSLASSVTTAYNGYVLELATDGTLALSNGTADEVFGLLYEPMLPDVEWPTVSAETDTVNIATHKAGKKVTALYGTFTARVGKDLFVGETLATYGDTIYNWGNGLLSNAQPTNGATLGKCIGVGTLYNSDDNDSGQSYETVAEILFTIS